MPNPWDRPPFPTSCDDNPDTTFNAVGRVMTHWETVEFELARLYSLLVGAPDGPALHQYGAGRIFRDRLVALRQAAGKHFVQRPHQAWEAQFDFVAVRAEGFSDRRNDVAHGVVFEVSGITFFRERVGLSKGGNQQFLLIPPIYARRWHDGGLPIFCYGSHEMIALHGQLRDLWSDIDAFRPLSPDAPHGLQDQSDHPAGRVMLDVVLLF